MSFSIAISLPTWEVCQASVMHNTCSTRAGFRERHNFLNFKQLFNVFSFAFEELLTW